jgi:hypothetical protein
MLKTILKTDNIKIFDADLRFRTLLICNPAAQQYTFTYSSEINSAPLDL